MSILNARVPKYLLSGQLLDSYRGARGSRKARASVSRKQRNDTLLARIKREAVERFKVKQAVRQPGEKKTGFFRRLLSLGRAKKG